MNPTPSQTASTTESIKTRFLIYSTDDVGATLTLEDEQLASSRDQALRQYIAAKGSDEVALAAISENACKLRIPPPRIGVPRVQDSAPAQPALPLDPDDAARESEGKKP